HAGCRWHKLPKFRQLKNITDPPGVMPKVCHFADLLTCWMSLAQAAEVPATEKYHRPARGYAESLPFCR
ncbi:hypothetical protein VS884_26500, partial [Escherichia coli]